MAHIKTSLNQTNAANFFSNRFIIFNYLLEN